MLTQTGFILTQTRTQVASNLTEFKAELEKCLRNEGYDNVTEVCKCMFSPNYDIEQTILRTRTHMTCVHLFFDVSSRSTLSLKKKLKSFSEFQIK